MRILPFLLLPLLLTAACRNDVPGQGESGEKPGVYSVADTDSGMNGAIAKAKATLGNFDQALKAGDPQLEGFALKTSFASESGGEHMWISDIEIVGDHYTGIVNNEPEFTKEVKYGDTIELERSRVTDWMYRKQGLLQGGYTIRLLRARMTPEERAEFDAGSGMIIED